ncbi:transposase [Chryseomicrobium sp. FSL W7-1435]|uniref:transposase n=1 Tax=Chryseomicrobium sp. FSL W7-1435 TaxID=2921704 RepID=UPI00315A231D
MPRKKREYKPNSFYHCILRGNNRHNVFPTDEDMHELLRAFELAYDRYPFQVVAFCFMSNHYHILIRAHEGTLSKIMTIANKRYSDSYHQRYGFIGRIYQGRYWSHEVPTVRGLLEVSAYIHRNPIDTEVPMVGSLEDYPYSSFPYYASSELITPRFLDTSYLPNLLPYPFEPTANGYLAFVLHRSFFAIEDGRKKEEEHSQALVPFKALELKNRGIRGMRTFTPEKEQPPSNCST